MFKKLSIIGLFLVLIGGIGCLFTYSQVTGKEITEEKSITESFSKIEVDTDSGWLKILPSKNEKARVIVNKKGADASDLSFKMRTEGETLKITAEDERNILIGFSFNKGVDITLYVPEKDYESVSVKTNNGTISMENLQAKKVKGQSDNGKIELTDIQAETVDVKTSNGKLKLDGVEGKLRGSTDNGAISLITAELDRDIDFETDNGKILIKTAKEPKNATFDVSTDNGKIDILGKYNGNAVIGNGDNLIHLETDNGKIDVTQ